MAQASKKGSSVTTPTSEDLSIRDIFGSSGSDSDNNDIHEPSCATAESNDVFLEADNDDEEIIETAVDNLQLIQDNFMKVTKNETSKEAGEEVKKEKVDFATKKRQAHSSNKVYM